MAIEISGWNDLRTKILHRGCQRPQFCSAESETILHGGRAIFILGPSRSEIESCFHRDIHLHRASNAPFKKLVCFLHIVYSMCLGAKVEERVSSG